MLWFTDQYKHHVTGMRHYSKKKNLSIFIENRTLCICWLGTCRTCGYIADFFRAYTDPNLTIQLKRQVIGLRSNRLKAMEVRDSNFLTLNKYIKYHVENSSLPWSFHMYYTMFHSHIHFTLLPSSSVPPQSLYFPIGCNRALVKPRKSYFSFHFIHIAKSEVIISLLNDMWSGSWVASLGALVKVTAMLHLNSFR